MALQDTRDQISLSEAAERLHLTYLATWQMAKKGRFPSLTRRAQGKAVRLFLSVEDVEAVIASREARHVSR